MSDQVPIKILVVLVLFIRGVFPLLEWHEFLLFEIRIRLLVG